MNTRAVAFGGHGYGHRAVAFRGWFVTTQAPVTTYWYADTGLQNATPDRELIKATPYKGLDGATPNRLIKDVSIFRGLIDVTPE